MPVLDEDAVKHLGPLESLRAAAYQSFSDRRSYEWKFCVSLWSALAFVDSTLVFGRDEWQKTMLSPGFAWGTVAAAALVWCAHVWWTQGLAQANAIDKRKASEVEDAIREKIGFAWSEDLKCQFRASRTACSGIWQWSHFVELVITLLLASIAVAAVMIHQAAEPVPPHCAVPQHLIVINGTCCNGNASEAIQRHGRSGTQIPERRPAHHCPCKIK